MTRKSLAFVVTTFPAIAFAQFYAGISVGQNRAEFNVDDYRAAAAGISESQDTDQSGFKLYGGYAFNPHLAVEAGYARLGTPAYRYTAGGAAGEAEVRQSSIFAAAKGALPITERFRVFGKLGLTYSRARLEGNSDSAAMNAAAGFPVVISENNIRALMGAGIEFALSENFLLRLEYDDFGKFGDSNITGETKARLTSIGLTYHF